MNGMMIHTDTPLLPLTSMIGGTAKIDVGATLRGGPDCFYGWFEPQDQAGCKMHHIVSGVDPEEMLWIAKTLVRIGHQVVVTALDEDGNDAVLDGAPRNYDWDHSH